MKESTWITWFTLSLLLFMIVFTIGILSTDPVIFPHYMDLLIGSVVNMVIAMIYGMNSESVRGDMCDV